MKIRVDSIGSIDSLEKPGSERRDIMAPYDGESLFASDLKEDIAVENCIWKREWIIIAVISILVALLVWLS